MALYAAQTNSPQTTLAMNLLADATTILVNDGSVFADLEIPNLLTLGYTQPNSETVLVTAISGDVLTVERAVDGTAADWVYDTPIARVFTALDWNTMIDEKADASSVPSAYSSTPEMDGTGAAGSSTAFAKGDHVHPSDTSKQDKITASGLLKGNGSGGVSAAVAGTDYAAPNAIPAATTTTPKMDGTAAVGSETKYAKGDHVHPTDTGRQAKITASGLLKGDGNGGVSAATAGTDYVAPSTLNNYVPTTDKGAASGVATLDTNTRVLAAQANAYIQSYSSAHTLALGDAGCCLSVTGTTTITIPANASVALPVGTEIEIMNYGTGTVTVKAASGVYLNGSSGGSKTISAQYTSGVIKCMATDTWVIQGAIS